MAIKNHFYTFISIVRLKTMTPKIYKTRILPKVGNMTLLPNPGKPGFYGVGLHGRVISCQPCSSEPSLHACAIGTKISQTSSFHDKSNITYGVEATRCNENIFWFVHLCVLVKVHQLISNAYILGNSCMFSVDSLYLSLHDFFPRQK